jgi:FkbM family methyltransferase
MSQPDSLRWRRLLSVALLLSMAFILSADIRTLLLVLIGGGAVRGFPPRADSTPATPPVPVPVVGGGETGLQRRRSSNLKGATWQKRAAEAGVPELEAAVPTWAAMLLADEEDGQRGEEEEEDERGSRAGAPLDDLPPTTVGWSAQDAEDSYAFTNYFYNRVEGTILELGALDGVIFSTSAYYERYMGWRAVHIEAGPGNFRNLTANRPGALNVHAACCASRRDVHVVESGAVGGIIEFMSPGFRDPWWPQYSDPKTWSALPTLPCLPLQTVLDIFGITHIDFFVLDVEGAELEVLKSLDMGPGGRLRVDVFTIEAESRDAESDKRIADMVELFEKSGYIIDGQVGRNLWVSRSDFIPSMGVRE